MGKSDEAAGGLREILAEESPLHRHEENAYIGAVREHFTEIRALRKDGYSFIQICRALVRDKKLPEDAKVRYFRQAFRREYRRLEKEGTLAALLNGTSRQTPKKSVVSPEKQKALHETYAQKTEAHEEEKIKKTDTGRVVHTGTGTIVKRPDGGFDF